MVSVRGLTSITSNVQSVVVLRLSSRRKTDEQSLSSNVSSRPANRSLCEAPCRTRRRSLNKADRKPIMQGTALLTAPMTSWNKRSVDDFVWRRRPCALDALFGAVNTPVVSYLKRCSCPHQLLRRAHILFLYGADDRYCAWLER